MYKTLIKKDSGEYCVYAHGEIYTSLTPFILADTATMESLEFYGKTYDNAVGIEWEKYEIVEVVIKLKK